MNSKNEKTHSIAACNSGVNLLQRHLNYFAHVSGSVFFAFLPKCHATFEYVDKFLSWVPMLGQGRIGGNVHFTYYNFGPFDAFKLCLQ